LVVPTKETSFARVLFSLCVCERFKEVTRISLEPSFPPTPPLPAIFLAF
jgi:hypothetical protein